MATNTRRLADFDSGVRSGVGITGLATAQPSDGSLDKFLCLHDYGNMEIKSIVRALAALAQETRLGIFRLLVQAGPTGLAAGEIGAELEIPAATLSFHLKELSYAGLIASRQDGRFIFYSANFEGMGALIAFLTENCCERDGVTCLPAATCRPSKAGVPTRTRRKRIKA